MTRDRGTAKPHRRPLKTYSHLAGARRMPTEYELLTSQLHYYLAKGFEVETPVAAWFREHQAGSPLQCGDWEGFADPRETTYAEYTALQQAKETFVHGLLARMGPDYDRSLSADWVERLGRVLAPLRYPCHGLQMIASYLGQIAPGGRITVAFLFQAADEVRRVQRLAYRVRQLQRTRPGFAPDSRAVWQEDPAWQPLREAVERLMVAYDWGAALVGLNLVLKPLLDEWVTLSLADAARGHGDHLLAAMLSSLREDAAWQREWTAALMGVVLEDSPENKPLVQAWVDEWHPPAARAVAALATLLPPGDAPTGFYGPYLGAMGLAAPAGEKPRP